MGNHNAGRAMISAASAAVNALGGIDNITQEQAVKLLDSICEPHRGCDAEFDDGLYIPEPLGLLVSKAFSPEREWVKEMEDQNENDYEVEDAWFDGPRTKFTNRYDFC